MPRFQNAQLKIRSGFARARATELSRATGMTTTQIVEEALRAYTPPSAQLPDGVEGRGPLLVLTGGSPISFEDANAALRATRLERG